MTALGRASVLNWLRSTAATTWNQPHGARADRIAALLTAAQLDVDTTRLVAFHAGLPSPIESAEPRTSDVAALPDKGSGVPAPRRGWWPWSRRRR